MVRKSLVAVCLLLLGMTLSSGILAQEAEVEVAVGEITIPVLRWGPQTVNMDITNNTDYYKIISILTQIDFEGIYLSPSKLLRTNLILEPEETRAVEADIIIPGNFGKADIKVEVYDVIDTLDVLMDYQRLVSQPFMVRYNLPEELESYFEGGLSFPPMVENSIDFDNEFSRLALQLTAEGKTPEEIAALAQCDLEHVNFVMNHLVKLQYAKRKVGGFVLNFPVISLKEAEEERVVAARVAGELANLVKTNLPTYKATMDSMVQAGLIYDNADDFMHGGSVLYYTWPAVVGLFFWFDLGQDFIEPNKILSIYRGSDFCFARIPHYFYAVQGGPYYNGTVFYSLEIAPEQMDIMFMDSVPDVGCVEHYERHTRLFPGHHWNYEEGVVIEPFYIDTVLINTAMTGMRPGVQEILDKAVADMTAIAAKYGHQEFSVGHRLWFWNLATTLAMRNMDENDILKRRGNGRYRFEETE